MKLSRAQCRGNEGEPDEPTEELREKIRDAVYPSQFRDCTASRLVYSDD
jgi:hypothetical protein